MRRSPGALVLLLLLALGVSLVAVPTSAQAAPSAAKYLVEARKHTNHERTTRDRSTLTNNECLAKFARAQAARMAKAGKISHTKDFDAIGKKCKLSAWGENVAQAVGADTGKGVVKMWMDSKGHRANILNATYRNFGMGAVYRDGKWWVVQVFGRKA